MNSWVFIWAAYGVMAGVLLTGVLLTVLQARKSSEEND